MILGLAVPYSGCLYVFGLSAALGVWALSCGRRGLALLMVCWILGGIYANRTIVRSTEGFPLEGSASAGVPVQGCVTDGPRPTGADGKRTTLELALLTVAGKPSRGRVLLSVSQGRVEAEPGDCVAFVALLEPIRGFRNPGEVSSRLLMAARGVVARSRVKHARQIRVLDNASWWHALGGTPARWARSARLAMRKEVDRVLAPPESTFIHTAVLGERMASGPQVELGFKAAGATHALSVSGLHLAAVAAVFFLGLRFVVGRVPWLAVRVSSTAVAALCSIPAVAFYTLITGAAVATVRSALMACVLFGAHVLARPFSLATSLSFSALVLLLPSPLWLLDVSFQLSFLSVLALALFATALLGNKPAGSGWWMKLHAWVASMMAATVAAGFVTAPLVAHHFGEVTPAAPLGNLFLSPLVELLVVPLGLAGAALACLWWPLGWPLIKLGGWASAATLWVADVFAKWAPIWYTSRPGPLVTLLFTAAVVAALVFVTRVQARGWSSGRFAAGLSVFLAASAGGALLIRDREREHRPNVEITFLDVGQGDAAVVQGPGGFVAVIDGGGLQGHFDTGGRIVGPFLRRKGISKIDLMILSHPHPDHMSGLFHLLERFDVDRLWVVSEPQDAQAERLAAHAGALGARPEQPKRLEIGGLVIQPTGPWLDGSIGAAPGLSVNDNSLSLRLSFAGRSLFFAGDLEGNGEFELVMSGHEIRADVLKVPHHGSRTSSSSELLHAVAPSVAVASLGVRNRFGFPHESVLARYRDLGIELLRTDQCGAVTIVLEKNGDLHATTVDACR